MKKLWHYRINDALNIFVGTPSITEIPFEYIKSAAEAEGFKEIKSLADVTSIEKRGYVWAVM